MVLHLSSQFQHWLYRWIDMNSSDILLRTNCSVKYKQDVVELKFGSTTIRVYYPTAFEIAAGILSASKMAARFEGVPPSKWAEMAAAIQEEAFEPLSRVYRRGRHRCNIKDWSLAFERNLVVLRFDDTTVKMHYSTSFELYGLTRIAAKNAKRWAGDTARQWTTRANLQNAEDNDKFVYTH